MAQKSDLPNLNHNISLQQAIEMTSRYRKEKGVILRPEVDKNVLPICESFNKTAFEELSRQPGCVGIRCYFGMDEKNNIKVLFVGVNDKDEDMLPPAGPQLAGGGSSIADVGQRCPPICPPSSPLNDEP